MPQEVENGLKTGEQVLDFLISSELQAKLLPLKIAFIIFSAGFLLVFVYLIWQTSFVKWWKLAFLRDFFTTRPFLNRRRINKTWQKIKKKAESNAQSQRNLALIKAYQLLEQNLQKRGQAGASLQERLNQLAEGQLTDLERLKKAVQICQHILKEPNYQLAQDKAKKVVHIFGQAFIDLELL